MFDIERVREEFAFVGESIYLNNAATTPLAKRVIDAMNEHLTQRNGINVNNWDWILEKKEELRILFGQIINAEPERIAILGNTTQGINTIVAGLDWEEGDEVLLPENEFPANVYPFLNLERKGVVIRFLRTPDGGLTPDILEENITERTKLLAMSFVEFLSGYKADLERIGRICRERGIIFFVDGIQGIGVLPFDVKKYNVDALACGGHKWLMCPQGVGFLYVTEELQKKVNQMFVGWLSVETPDDFLNYRQSLARGARRYELGSFNSAGVAGAVEALKMLLRLGVEVVSSYTMSLVDRIYEGICEDGLVLYSNRDERYRSAIVTFYPQEKDKTEQLINYLKSNNIEVSLREGMVRVSPHFYNTFEEIDKFLRLCREFIGEERK